MIQTLVSDFFSVFDAGALCTFGLDLTSRSLFDIQSLFDFLTSLLSKFCYLTKIRFARHLIFRKMCKKEKKITHSNEANRIIDSTYNANVNNSENNSVNDNRRFRESSGIDGRNNRKTNIGIQMTNGDPSDASYQYMKSLCQVIFGCGSVFMLNQEKFLN